MNPPRTRIPTLNLVVRPLLFANTITPSSATRIIPLRTQLRVPHSRPPQSPSISPHENILTTIIYLINSAISRATVRRILCCNPPLQAQLTHRTNPRNGSFLDNCLRVLKSEISKLRRLSLMDESRIMPKYCFICRGIYGVRAPVMRN